MFLRYFLIISYVQTSISCVSKCKLVCVLCKLFERSSLIEVARLLVYSSLSFFVSFSRFGKEPREDYSIASKKKISDISEHSFIEIE